MAIATVASQGVSAILSLFVLSRSDGYAKLEKKYFKVFKKELFEIIRYGLPIGFQRCMFSLSNVFVASSINAYGEQIMTANTISHQFDMIIHDSTDAFSMAIMAFISQNLGARNYKRVWQVIWRGLGMVTVVSVTLGIVCVLFRYQLCSIMTNDLTIIKYGAIRLVIMGSTQFLVGFMNVFANVLRGMGKNFSTMASSLLCTCVFRILWLKTLYLLFPSLEMLYAVYPISWALCAICNLFLSTYSLKKEEAKYIKQTQSNSGTDKAEQITA